MAKTIPVRIPAELHARLARAAAKHGRTVRQELEHRLLNQPVERLQQDVALSIRIEELEHQVRKYERELDSIQMPTQE